MELAGGAYFFAYLGFMIMVIVGWLLAPRASFIVATALFVHKAGWINLKDGEGVETVVSIALILALVILGIMLDFGVLKKFLQR